MCDYYELYYLPREPKKKYCYCDILGTFGFQFYRDGKCCFVGWWEMQMNSFMQIISSETSGWQEIRFLQPKKLSRFSTCVKKVLVAFECLSKNV
jgi:hypothetical protein